VLAYKEQYPGASQQNIANYYYSILWGKPLSQHCIGDILSGWRGEREFLFTAIPALTPIIDGGQSMALQLGSDCMKIYYACIQISDSNLQSITAKTVEKNTSNHQKKHF
jgi:hypothetical protein